MCQRFPPRLSVTGSKNEGWGDYVLVPFVDSMNHVTTAKTELSFSPLSGDLGVSVNRYEGGFFYCVSRAAVSKSENGIQLFQWDMCAVEMSGIRFLNCSSAPR